MSDTPSRPSAQVPFDHLASLLADPAFASCSITLKHSSAGYGVHIRAGSVHILRDGYPTIEAAIREAVGALR